MNDPTRLPVPVSASALLRYLMVAVAEALVFARVACGICGTPGPLSADQRAQPATRAHGLGVRQLAAPEPQPRTLTETSLPLRNRDGSSGAGYSVCTCATVTVRQSARSQRAAVGLGCRSA